MTKKYEYEIPKYFSGGFYISKYHSEERIIQDLKNKMGIRGYAFDGDFLILGSAKINIRNVKHWDKDHVLTDSIIFKKIDTTFNKIGTITYENNGTKLIIEPARLEWHLNQMTLKNNPEIVIKKWKRRGLVALEEQLAHGRLTTVEFNNLVDILIEVQSKKEYVECYWSIVEKENLHVNC